MIAVKRFFQWIVVIGIVTGAALSAIASEGIILSKGQTVYVPVYSNVISGPREVPAHLSNTLIIRNTDLHNHIQVTVADYYNTHGGLIKRYYTKPVTMTPLETAYIYLSERDQEGVSGEFYYPVASG